MPYTLQDRLDWERGIGTLNEDCTVLERTTVLMSSRGNLALHLHPGAKIVFKTVESLPPWVEPPMGELLDNADGQPIVIVISPNDPVDDDGRPDGTLYFQTTA